MKKIFALLMAMIMLLSCSAMAETKPGVESQTQLYINPELVAGYGEEVLTLIETINSITIELKETDSSMTVAYGANDTEFYEYSVAMDNDGSLLLFSSLIPNTAIKLDMAKIVEIVAKYLPADVQMQLAQLGEMAMAAINALYPYVEDLAAVIEEVAGSVEMDETGVNGYLTITTHHAAKLFYAWFDRLSKDEVLLPICTQLYSMAQDSYYAPSFAEVLEDLKGQMQQTLQSEAQELASVGMYEDGLEITVGNVMLVSMSNYEQDGYQCVDALVVVAPDGTNDWSATYNSVYDGSNYSDIIVGLTVAMLPTGDYVYEQLYLINSGTTLALTAEVVTDSTNPDAAQLVASLDLAQGEQVTNLGGLTTQVTFVDAIEVPTTEDKYVLDVFALPADLLINGLPKAGQDICKALPELVNLVAEAFTEATGIDLNLNLEAPVAGNDDIIENNTPATTDTPAAPAREDGIEDL